MTRIVKRDANGHKLWQKDSEDRTTEYRKWRLEGVGISLLLSLLLLQI
jgi:hypothetical protein